MATKKKQSALQMAASKKLGSIGPKTPSAEEIAHMMMHAEERGEVERVALEDGSWVWAAPGSDGKPRILRPTVEMLEALDRFAREGHPAH
jgi:hypothetical protein